MRITGGQWPGVMKHAPAALLKALLAFVWLMRALIRHRLRPSDAAIQKPALGHFIRRIDVAQINHDRRRHGCR